MQDNILNKLFILFETSNQLDLLYKDEFGDILKKYTYTEMHCIDCIGKVHNPNVTKIAHHLNLTKAGVSKIIKKLADKKAVEDYKSPDNRKETYYKLTEIGREVYDKHLNMHKNWYEKDKSFFKQFGKNELEVTFDVLDKYAVLLQKRLEDIKENLR